MTPCSPRLISSTGSGKRTACAVMLWCVLSAGGCAGGATNAMQAVNQDLKRQLTMRCYWQQEGERVVYGASAVLEACRDWAQRRIAARYRTPVAAYQ